MARVQNVLIGRASGSVGNATFSTWKGINVLKAKPESVAQPNTPAQQGQKNRMTLIVSVYRLIAAIILFGYKEQAIKKSEYNAFVSDNIMDAISLDSSQVASLDFPLLKVSKGTIGDTAITGNSTTVQQRIVTIDWDDTLTPVGGAQTDIAYLAVYDVTNGVWYLSDGTDLRSDGTVSTGVMGNVALNQDYEAYLFFYAAAGGSSSDSVHIQSTAL